MSNQDDILLSVEDLSVAFRTDHGSANVVQGVSFKIRRGEIMGLVGESGSGKSVTALVVMGLLPQAIAKVSSGRVLFDGKDLTRMPERDMRKLRGPRIGMIFQEPLTALNPVFTVGSQIIAGILAHEPVSKQEAHARAVQLLQRVGIPEPARRMDAYPFQLSGGMRQRAMIAMAIACSPDLLIADEPTTALDVTIQAQILDLLREIRDEMGISILFITHDLAIISELCDSVAVFYAGEMQERGSVRQVFAAPHHPYTSGLLSCIPDVARGERLKAIEGHPPARLSDVPGCRFAPRCPNAIDLCSQVHPSIERLPDGAETRCFRWKEIQACN
ncbi:ABC transporter ATP-binding protein [Afipia carboxidovorans]|uniref:ABC transporter ATP-binding protein n=1 Tax=Afipia carboxidovorans TaxID=40137 RepID=UPI0030869216|nr:ABC transporter ATP-binding protein [Afipia carboxidovorans]